MMSRARAVISKRPLTGMDGLGRWTRSAKTPIGRDDGQDDLPSRLIVPSTRRDIDATHGSIHDAG